MKLFLLVVCFVALAAARPKKDNEDREGKKGPNPVEGLVKLCFGLAEEAMADDSKRSWEDVFGQLAPLCGAILEELEADAEKRGKGGKSMGGKKGGKKMGSGDEDDDGFSDFDGPKPSGPPPSGMPPKDWFDERGKGGKDMDGKKDGKKMGKGGKGGDKEKGDKDMDDEWDEFDGYSGPKPSGPPPSGMPPKFDMRGKGGKGDKDDAGRPKPSGAPPKDGDDGVDFVEALLKVCEGLAKMAEKEEAEGAPKRSLEAVFDAMESICEGAFEQAKEDGMF